MDKVNILQYSRVSTHYEVRMNDVQIAAGEKEYVKYSTPMAAEEALKKYRDTEHGKQFSNHPMTVVEVREQITETVVGYFPPQAEEKTYRTVDELSDDELTELRSRFFDDAVEAGRTDKILPGEDYDFAWEIPMGLIKEHYKGTTFVKEDFFCNL